TPATPLATGASTPPASGRGGRSLTLPLLVGGAGVVAAGVGGFLLWTARSKYDDLVDQGCKPNCDPDDWAGYDTRTTAGNVLLVGGGVLVAGGVLLYVLRSGDDDSASGEAETTATRVLVGPGGLAVSGRF
ncbi:MAG TPA: hypothetical protein VMZ28_00380, partial [Kofleriaceae bacterium]|nr:hypothetical protein [Kofleriaceae bacterium]